MRMSMIPRVTEVEIAVPMKPIPAIFSNIVFTRGSQERVPTKEEKKETDRIV
jgi:hypothetical protein